MNTSDLNNAELLALIRDHSAAWEFVREIAGLDCRCGDGACIVARARKWLHTPTAPPRGQSRSEWEGDANADH